MIVRDTSSTAEAATQATARAQPAPKTDKPQNKPAVEKPNPVTDVVEISDKAGVVVEKHGAANKADEAETTENRVKPETAERDRGDDNAAVKEVRRDYAVDNGGLVVKVIDTKENEVIREIPPEEERKIRQAISKVVEKELDKNSPEGAPGQIDVTS